MTPEGTAGGANPLLVRLGSPTRVCGFVSLLVLILHTSSIVVASRSAGRPFSLLEPWPLGGGVGEAGPLAPAITLLLGLSLGWGVPGLSLALLTDRRLTGAALLRRAFGMGIGYIVATGLAHAALFGHAPRRSTLLILLGVPPVLALLRPGSTPNGGARVGRTIVAAAATTAIIMACLWGKLAREGMNGDGTEAYELARSLESHPLPRWDLERWEGPGKFGTPAVNPFLTNSYLVGAEMTLIGRGELAARLPLVPALALCALIAGAWVRRPGVSGWSYVAAVTAVYALWNGYYVGYEPPFTDLAEPAATDTLMTALWLAGFAEVAAGSTVMGVGFLLLASGVLYSAPLLATVALASIALLAGAHGRRALRLWIVAGAAVLGAALLVGAVTGDLADWIRQVRSEYWEDFASPGRRTPGLPLVGLLMMMTGGLPLAAVFRWRRLSRPSRALLLTSAVYLLIVLLSSYKNLHYLAPLPFLLAPASLEASGPRLRALGVAVAATTFVLSWPGPREVHRETVELGEVSCVDGVGYEEASLGADVVYDAFARPGRAGRLAVGKHTFVRYALDRGGAGCHFRLSSIERDGWIPVAGDSLVLWARDPDTYAAWRFRQPPAPSSWRFPRTSPPPLPAEARAWSGRLLLTREPGSALVMETFAPRRSRARLLVPAASPADKRLVLGWRDADSLVFKARVNGRSWVEITGASGSEVALETPPWRPGWNVLELQAPTAERHPALEWIEVRRK